MRGTLFSTSATVQQTKTHSENFSHQLYKIKMARLIALFALFACLAIAFAAEAEKKDDLEPAAGHYYGGYGLGFHRGFYGGFGYPGFYRGYGHYGGFYPRFGHGFYG